MVKADNRDRLYRKRGRFVKRNISNLKLLQTIKINLMRFVRLICIIKNTCNVCRNSQTRVSYRHLTHHRFRERPVKNRSDCADILLNKSSGKIQRAVEIVYINGYLSEEYNAE